MKISNICIIGAGKIAHSLIPALIENGYTISTIISRRLASAQKPGALYNIPLIADTVSSIPEHVDCIIIAVPDQQIGAVAEDIANNTTPAPNRAVLHLSGSLNSAILAPVARPGTLTASIHFMQTFSSLNRVPLTGSCAAIECTDDTLGSELVQLCLTLGTQPFQISRDLKTLYHVMGVFLSNFLIGNLQAAETIFQSLQIDAVTFWQLANPIIQATLEHARESGITRALSGPVERGSSGVISDHVNSLIQLQPALLQSYMAQSKHLIEIAKQKAPEKEDLYNEIHKVLHKSG
ncbi:MAG: DUF2520 domain-containing protein [Ignavibacteria bacterium]|nr:DUF2520 domain-containing protein [Ignavibacteria bacterium]